MTFGDITEIVDECQRRRYEYRIPEKDFQEKECKKLRCLKNCSISEYMENLECNGLLKKG